jgi:hypothetical protein
MWDVSDRPGELAPTTYCAEQVNGSSSPRLEFSTKTCSKCRTSKPIQAFYFNKHKAKHDSQCADCKKNGVAHRRRAAVSIRTPAISVVRSLTDVCGAIEVNGGTYSANAQEFGFSGEEFGLIVMAFEKLRQWRDEGK